MEPSLTIWRAADAPDLLLALSDSADLAMQFGGDAPETLAQAERYIIDELADESSRSFAVRLDDRVVGNVRLGHIERTHDTAWVSYWIASSARGRGLAAWALRQVARVAFDDLGLFRLELGHRVNNPASCRVATAAGFAIEGIERAKLRYGATRFDVETHSRLATDWFDPSEKLGGLRYLREPELDYLRRIECLARDVTEVAAQQGWLAFGKDGEVAQDLLHRSVNALATNLRMTHAGDDGCCELDERSAGSSHTGT